MDSTQHARPETLDIGTLNGESDESSVPPGNFWRERTIDELAVQQGIAVPQSLDQVIGAAAGLWEDDGDCDRFVQEIYDRRLDQRRRGGGE